VDGAAEIPEAAIEPSVAIGTGYSESKWVGERLLEIAAKKTPLVTTSVRIGQISGGKNGSWSTAEWLPSLVRSAVQTRCLPSFDGVVSWVPLPVAASAIVDFRSACSPFLHLVHPKPVKWDTVFEELASSIGVPLVSFDEWLNKLESGAKAITAADEVDSLKLNPALRIIDFYRAASAHMRTPNSGEAMGFPTLSMVSAMAASSTLASPSLKCLDCTDVQSWVTYWKSVGYLP